MSGQPGKIHDHTPTPGSFQGMDTWMTSQLNVALICKSHGSLLYLAYSLTCYPWVFVQPGTGNVWLTGAGIKCLYCISTYF